MKVFSQISVIWWPSRAALKDLLGNHEGAVQILGVLAALTVLCLPWSQTVMTYWLCWIKILPDQTKPTSTFMTYLPTWPTQWVVPTCWSTHLIYLRDYADDRDYADSADNDLHILARPADLTYPPDITTGIVLIYFRFFMIIFALGNWQANHEVSNNFQGVFPSLNLWRYIEWVRERRVLNGESRNLNSTQTDRHIKWQLAPCASNPIHTFLRKKFAF